MSHQSTLVFVEVCYRHSSNFMDPVTTISCYKRHRLIKTALYYLQNIGLPIRKACHFDVIGTAKNRQITWIKNAIEVEY